MSIDCPLYSKVLHLVHVLSVLGPIPSDCGSSLFVWLLDYYLSPLLDYKLYKHRDHLTYLIFVSSVPTTVAGL